MEENNFDNRSGMSEEPEDLSKESGTDAGKGESGRGMSESAGGAEQQNDSQQGGADHSPGQQAGGAGGAGQQNNSQYGGGNYNGGQYGGNYNGGQQNNDQYRGNYYSGQQNGNYYGGQQGGGWNRGSGYYRQQPKKKCSVIPVIVIILAVVLLFFTVFSFTLRVLSGNMLKMYGAGTGTGQDDDINYSLPYIGVLPVEGTIQSDSGSALYEGTYHHEWTLKKIEQLKEDNNNRGLVIAVNTPGGGVYESDELYLAIKDYKETTGRPVYSYMESQATSGGYYISAPCDKIMANRNCWTGSIGVTIGTIYDFTGLMEKYGVKSVTITAGDNKAMGSSTEKLTREQKEILQSLVDEAYEQFVGIVAEGRGMKVEDVKELADGRLYTAKQAKENGLIDEVCTYDEAVDDMKTRFELGSCAVHEIKYKNSDPLLYRLLMQTAEIGKDKSVTEFDGLKSLMDQNGKFKVTYLSEIQK